MDEALLTNEAAYAERVAQLVLVIVDALREAGLSAEPGPAVQWGQKVVVATSDGVRLGNLIAYWGEKGPRVTFNELRPELSAAQRHAVRKAAETAVASVGGDLGHPGGGVLPPAAPGTVEIWVDGSYVSREPHVAVGWAFIARKDGEELHRASGSDIPPGAEKHWNVAGEIVAVLKALEWCEAEGITQVAIYHDYESLPFWPTGRWRAKTDLTRSYAREVAASGIRIEWHWVRSHAGAKHNEAVDKLARDAALTALDGRQHPDL